MRLKTAMVFKTHLRLFFYDQMAVAMRANAQKTAKDQSGME
jgi:hypothetical protein